MTIGKAEATSVHTTREMESRWDRKPVRDQESRILTIPLEYYQKWIGSASSVENTNTNLGNNTQHVGKSANYVES